MLKPLILHGVMAGWYEPLVSGKRERDWEEGSYSLFLPTLPTLCPFCGRVSYWEANPEPRGIAAPCKAIQDGLGFWIPRHGFRIPETGFWILCQLNWDSGFLELYSRFKKPWACGPSCSKLG